jgi:hypothetical protein
VHISGEKNEKEKDPGNKTSVRGRKHEPYTVCPNSPRPKKARQVKSQTKSMFIIFFDINGVVHKEFVWPAKQ